MEGRQEMRHGARMVWWLTLVFALWNLFDALSTQAALAHGGWEFTPGMAWAMAWLGVLPALLLIKSGALALLVIVTRWCTARTERQSYLATLRVFLWIANGFGALLLVNNLHTLWLLDVFAH